ncbi:MAG: hypothetical protein U9O18_06870 [Chloroflexota bacterium]|nr:hypothetical protein [Chloroflexota bacterium]
MSALRTILSGMGEGMTPDGTLVRARMRVTLDMIVTLLVSIMAVGLIVGFQVLRHLPDSWRESLLGDGPSGE